jgi:inosine triphosphate pyrophosphatase
MAAPPLRILFCTGNDGKFKEAVHALEGLTAGGVSAGRVTVCSPRNRAGMLSLALPLSCAHATPRQVTRCDADPEEVQGGAEHIARAKTAAALALLRAAGHPLEGSFDFLVTEDVSFHLGCLNGFPGPYVKGAWGHAQPAALRAALALS